MKKEKAITLIALMITIIILLILAGVTIATLMKNELFEKVIFAKEKNEESIAKEKTMTKLMEYTMYGTDKKEELNLEGLKEYFNNDKEIEEIILYYEKQANIIDNFQTEINGKAIYANVKLKKYKYIFTINQKLEIIETLVNQEENNEENNGILERDLQDYLNKINVSLELQDILTSKNIVKQILDSETAMDYILEDKECIEIILNYDDISNLFFSNEYFYNKINNKIKNNTIENSEELIPQLASNNGKNGRASCSSSYGNAWDAWIAFNNQTNGDGWYPTDSPSWIQYEFNNFEIVNKFHVLNNYGFDQKVPNAKFQYSCDGTNWIDATEFKEYTINKDIYIELKEAVLAKYYRLYLTTGVRLYKFQLYGSNVANILNYDVENKNEKNKLEKIISMTNVKQIKFEDILCSDSMIEKMDNNNPVTVPIMESENQDGYIITSTSYYENGNNWAGWKAFDNDLTSTYTFFPTTVPAWVQVEYPSKVALYKAYCSTLSKSVEINFKILSSNDGINWITRTGNDYTTLNTPNAISLLTTEFAKYWRFETINNNQYYNLQFYGFKE